MALFVIGDLHLSLGADKPMDIFPGWKAGACFGWNTVSWNNSKGAAVCIFI